MIIMIVINIRPAGEDRLRLYTTTTTTNNNNKHDNNSSNNDNVTPNLSAVIVPTNIARVKISGNFPMNMRITLL